MITKDDILDALKGGEGFRRYYSQNLALINKGNGQAMTKCPFHDDNNPSLSINTNDGNYNCFGCGRSGDIFSFRMKYENINFDECLKRFASELNLHTSGKDESINYSMNDVKKWHDNIFSDYAKEAKAFLIKKRGINENSIRKYFIGFDFQKKAITIPIYNTEALSCVKFFNYDFVSGEKKITTSGKASMLGITYLTFYETKDADIYITEGELDAIVLSQFGLLTVSGSAGALTWKKEWTKYFKDANVIICYDSDNTGREGSKKAALELAGIAKSIKIIDLFGKDASKDKKDITDYFVKCNYSIDDFRLLVNNTPLTNSDELKKEPSMKTTEYVGEQKPKTSAKGKPALSEAAFLNMVKNEKFSEMINPAQDYTTGKMYYAIKVENEKFLISSDRSITKFSDAAEKGLYLTTMELDMFRLSSNGITKIYEGNNHETPNDIFTIIRSYIERFIFLKKQETYSLLALWVMGTYLYRVFRYFPYIHLNAEKGSGKTMLMEVMAPICFNGQISANSTEAVIFRDIQNNSPTLFLDELEKMSKEDKEKFAGIMSVLKTGFSKNGLVKRCDGKNKDKIRSFSTYAPKMFAGIKDLDDVLSDRTIKIKMYRKLNNEFFERYTECKDNIDTQKYIRDILYSFGLKYADKIETIYNEPDIPVEFNNILNNRELDIWLPIITIAQLIDTESNTDLVNEMLTYSTSYLEEKKSNDASENDTVKILNILNQFIPTHSPDTIKENLLYYKTDTVFNFFKEQEEYNWLDSKTWLSRQLKKLEIKTEKYNLSGFCGRMYLINKSLLEDYTRRYC